MATKNQAQRARAKTPNAQAWWYENARSIQVVTQDKATNVLVSCVIGRAALKSWLERTEKNKKAMK